MLITRQGFLFMSDIAIENMQFHAIRSGGDYGPFRAEGFIHVGGSDKYLYKVEVPGVFATCWEATQAGIDAARQFAVRMLS